MDCLHSVLSVIRCDCCFGGLAIRLDSTWIDYLPQQRGEISNLPPLSYLWIHTFWGFPTPNRGSQSDNLLHLTPTDQWVHSCYLKLVVLHRLSRQPLVVSVKLLHYVPYICNDRDSFHRQTLDLRLNMTCNLPNTDKRPRFLLPLRRKNKSICQCILAGQ